MQAATTRISEIDYQTNLAPVLPWDEGIPAINGADIYGASPQKDFLYLVPTTGERPLSFTAENLPKGLKLDSESGQIHGQAEENGEYDVLLKAKNRLGETSKKFKIVIAPNALALTPPMGWNSWNCYRMEINDEKIRNVATGLVNSGLAARGYSYINLDSAWQSKQRGGKFNSIIPHEGFPDMKALCAHIHKLGLKAGIYSGPYVQPWGSDGCGTSSGLWDTSFPLPYTCTSKYIGLDKHEREDVSQWAEWGFDYFKYDWALTDMIMTKRMSEELRNSSRDIIFSVTTNVDIQDAWKIKELSNLWRSNKDTAPTWDSVLKNGFNNEQWNPVIGPGHWFDLDMTAIQPRHGNSLSPNELIAYISCWMMRPSPILIDCDPAAMDDFTLRLLCNEEIIAVNQDSMGKPAASLFKNDTWDIQLKPLIDGNYAVAFFNLGKVNAVVPYSEIRFLWEQMIGDKFRVRDLWNKKDIGEPGIDFVVGVNPHCAKVYKIFINK